MSAITPTSDVVLDIGVQVALEVGRARMTIRDLLALGPGSVIELTRSAGDPLDVYVNDRLVARGEVVMVNERYGVRFTDPLGANESRR